LAQTSKGYPELTGCAKGEGGFARYCSCGTKPAPPKVEQMLADVNNRVTGGVVMVIKNESDSCYHVLNPCLAKYRVHTDYSSLIQHDLSAHTSNIVKANLVIQSYKEENEEYIFDVLDKAAVQTVGIHEWRSIAPVQER
jgi:hypothetical protein